MNSAACDCGWVYEGEADAIDALTSHAQTECDRAHIAAVVLNTRTDGGQHVTWNYPNDAAVLETPGQE